MGSKTISVDDEAYALLKAAKIGEESFSDVVKRTLAPSRPKLTDLVGLLTKEEGRKLKASMARAKKEGIAADERRRKKLWG